MTPPEDRVIRTVDCPWCPAQLQVEFRIVAWDDDAPVRGTVAHDCPAVQASEVAA